MCGMGYNKEECVEWGTTRKYVWNGVQQGNMVQFTNTLSEIEKLRSSFQQLF